MAADGSEITSLNIEGADPKWSPDGTRIVYVAGDGQQVWTAAADGSDRQRLTDLKSSIGAPAHSPDGDKILFHSPRRGPFSRIWITDAEGTAPQLFDAIPQVGAAHPVWISAP